MPDDTARSAPLPTSTSFRSLFEAEFPFVCRALERFGVRHADAPDCAQEIFLTFFQRFSQWDQARPLRPYLVAYASRFAANYRRLGWHRLGGDAPQEAHSPFHGDEAAIAKAQVLRGLDALSDDQRVALVMHDLEELTGAEIAEALQIPLFTVYSRVRSARVIFRATVEDALGTASPRDRKDPHGRP